MPTRVKNAFTIVELLVVIAIIAMLVTILLPAINSAREAARNVQCKNRLKQLAIAANSYESQNRGYPYYRSIIRRPVVRQVSWFVYLASHLGEQRIHDAWRTARNADLPRPHLSMLVCPSDATVDEQVPAISYMANSGRPETRGRRNELFVIRDFGVFVGELSPSNARTSLEFLQERGDGAATTLMLAENIQLLFNGGQVATRWDLPFYISPPRGWEFVDNDYSSRLVWHATTHPQPTMRINGDLMRRELSAETARPASFHSGGVNAAFCDGRVAFVRDDISYRVYIQLMVPRDAAIKKVDPAFADELGDLAPLTDQTYQ